MSIIMEFYHKLRQDYSFRSIIMGICSLIASIFMGIFSLVTGLNNQAKWNIAISAYYFFLVIIRMTLFMFEFRIRNKAENEKEKLRRTRFYIYGMLMILMDISLVWPVCLIISKEKNVYVTTEICIVFAVYSFGKFALAVYNIIKTKNDKYSLTVRMLKILSLTNAIVSIMNLQSMMILTFGNYDDDMRLLSSYTNTLFILSLVVITFLTIKKGLTIKKEVIKSQNFE